MHENKKTQSLRKKTNQFRNKGVSTVKKKQNRNEHELKMFQQ